MRFLLIALGLWLAGCSEQSTALPYPLTISQEGLGAIHPDTPFEEIPTRMLGFECEKLSAVSSSDPTLIYQIKRGGKPLADIVSDPSGKKIVSIHILSPLIRDSHDQALGEVLGAEPFVCDGARCVDPQSPSVRYTIHPSTRTIREITHQRL
jgi:hypothetical protein